MGIWNRLFGSSGKKRQKPPEKTPAQRARERLSIIIYQDRADNQAQEDIELSNMIQAEICETIRNYIHVDRDDIRMQLSRRQERQVLECDINIQDKEYTEQYYQLAEESKDIKEDALQEPAEESKDIKEDALQEPAELTPAQRARERLSIIIYQDRIDIRDGQGAVFLNLIKTQIFKIVRKYIVVTEDDIKMQFSREQERDALECVINIYNKKRTPQYYEWINAINNGNGG